MQMCLRCKMEGSRSWNKGPESWTELFSLSVIYLPLLSFLNSFSFSNKQEFSLFYSFIASCVVFTGLSKSFSPSP